MKLSLIVSGLCALLASTGVAEAKLPDAAAIDAEVAKAMQATGSRGLAIAVIDDGVAQYWRSYGSRNAKDEPLQADTIMYGASLTKAVFGHYVMQLVEEKKIDLDTSIAEYLPKPLPEYTDNDKYSTWPDLAGDERWRKLTPRILLNHGSGFANFGFLEPDGKLKFHFEPGSRYAYSGDGLILLQFVIEQGLGIDVGQGMQQKIFGPLGMRNTSMIWRPDFLENLADGWKSDGSVEPHDERSTVRAAGSMDTTIEDMAKFAAAYVRGDGLAPKNAAERTRPQLLITTASQFPTLQDELPPAKRRADLAAGLGVVVFDGPQGPGFFKGGHNDSTGNIWVCLQRSRRCVLILSNDVRSERAFPHLVRFILGETGAPYDWEYGDMKPWTPGKAGHLRAH